LNDTVAEYAEKVKAVLDETELNEPLEHRKIRYTMDDRNESLGKKIREATKMKIPCLLIVGPKDAEAEEVSVRLRDSEAKVKLAELKKYLCNL
jgi:threonyl-tRNA synthetase